MWDRRGVDAVALGRIRWERCPDGRFGAGEQQRVLSSDGQGAYSAVLRLRQRHAGSLAGGADVLVLAGSGTLNGQPFDAGCYFHVPAGAPLDFEPGAAGASLFVGFLGDARLGPAQARPAPLLHLDTKTLPWRAPEWSERSPTGATIFAQPLREGDDARVMVVAMLPGRHTEEEECHPVFEESFRLSGDLLMGEHGVMLAGSYSFRRPGRWHGPMGTRYGTMSLVRSSGHITTEYRPPPPGATFAELARAAYARVPAPAFWFDEP